MGERQEDLTTADLAGQPPSGPTDTNQSDLIEEVDLERRDDLTPRISVPAILLARSSLPGISLPGTPPSTRSQAARP